MLGSGTVDVTPRASAEAGEQTLSSRKATTRREPKWTITRVPDLHRHHRRSTAIVVQNLVTGAATTWQFATIAPEISNGLSIIRRHSADLAAALSCADALGFPWRQEIHPVGETPQRKRGHRHLSSRCAFSTR
jgi:hypothetical protein